MTMGFADILEIIKNILCGAFDDIFVTQWYHSLTDVTDEPFCDRGAARVSREENKGS